jgi:hypothetical protein
MIYFLSDDIFFFATKVNCNFDTWIQILIYNRDPFASCHSNDYEYGAVSAILLLLIIYKCRYASMHAIFLNDHFSTVRELETESI